MNSTHTCSLPDSHQHAPGLWGGIRGKQVSLRLFFGSANDQAETILCRIGQAPGTSNGRETTAVLTTQILLTGAITGLQSLGRDRTRFTAHYPTMTKQILVTGPKLRGLFHGLKRPTKGRLSPLAKIGGSLSAKAIVLRTPNGKMPDRSAPITGNMFLVTSGQNLI